MSDHDLMLRRALASAPGVVYARAVDGGRSISFVSEAVRGLLGYEAVEFTRDPSFWADHIHPEDRPRALAVRSRIHQKERLSCEYRFLHANGAYRWLLDECLLVRGEAGRPVEVVGCLLDITARKADEARVVRVERLAAVGEAVAGLGRESRNAFQRSQACLAMLALDLQDRPAALDLIARAREAQDRLYRLLQQAQEYAAPVRLRRHTCHLGTIVQEAWSQLAALRQGRVTRLRESGDIDLSCQADQPALEQVFRAVLEHSLGVCADPVEIEVRWSLADPDGAPAVRAAFRDNGPDLTPEEKKHIFEPFFTTQTHGVSLGMALAERLVEAHGGRIIVGDSPRGAEIVITLPRGNCASAVHSEEVSTA